MLSLNEVRELAGVGINVVSLKTGVRVLWLFGESLVSRSPYLIVVFENASLHTSDKTAGRHF